MKYCLPFHRRTRGTIRLQHQWRAPISRLRFAFTILLFFGLPTYIHFANKTLSRKLPFARVQNAIRHIGYFERSYLSGTKRGLRSDRL